MEHLSRCTKYVVIYPCKIKMSVSCIAFFAVAFTITKKLILHYSVYLLEQFAHNALRLFLHSMAVSSIYIMIKEIDYCEQNSTLILFIHC